MKTSFLTQKQINKSWFIIDATDAVVGRLAAFLSIILRGKNKPDYTPHLDCGDNVIIINADKVCFTGKKKKDKIYYRHTGYPGGIKSTSPEKILKGKFPERVLKLAVERMIGDGPLAKQRFSNLYVYAGPEHKHAAQRPEILDFASLNVKNVRKV